MIQVFFHPYYLTPRHAMNAVTSASIRQGALLKWVWEDGKIGYSDLHPWPEFGDRPLSHQLEGVRQGQLFPQVMQSQWAAERDAAGRLQQQNIFKQPHLLKNNFILPAIQDLTPELLLYLQGQGFDMVKIKMGRNLKAETEVLSQIVGGGFKLRLDFNSALTPDSFKSFVESLATDVLSFIEYVEDPFTYEFKSWTEANALIPLAIDQELMKVSWKDLTVAPFSVVVLKPAKMPIFDILTECENRNLKVTVTSYMDHPLGVMHAAILASELKALHGDMILGSGCLTHMSYQMDEFSKQMSTQGPFLNPVAGIGVGFDKQLSEVPWQVLARI